MTGYRLSFALVAVLVLAGAGLTAYAWPRTLPPIDPATRTGFDPTLIARGAALASLGNCSGCHSVSGQPAYSGGAPVETPFGTIYASNITPDPETGIGRWSETAFRRAMRDGIDREGRHLYPAFPYDHYTLVSDVDNRALYAFVMTRPPARRRTPAATLPFPLRIRAVMAGWNLLFLHRGPYAPDPGRDHTWNRGAYLVEGLGHCGACHTPRNTLGAERRNAPLSGGVAEGWNAYALDASSPAPVPWTVDALSFYLKHGWHRDHGVSRGPMAEVTDSLGKVTDDDTDAMAVYLVSAMGRSSADRIGTAMALGDQAPRPLHPASAGSQVAVPAATTGRPGAAIYVGACASCHDSGRAVPFGGLALELSSALHAPDPSNIVSVTLRGLAVPSGRSGAMMPGFAGSLDDAQIAALLSFLRDDVAHEPPWPDLDATVRAARARATSSETASAAQAGMAP